MDPESKTVSVTSWKAINKQSQTQKAVCHQEQGNCNERHKKAFSREGKRFESFLFETTFEVFF